MQSLLLLGVSVVRSRTRRRRRWPECSRLGRRPAGCKPVEASGRTRRCSSRGSRAHTSTPRRERLRLDRTRSLLYIGDELRQRLRRLLLLLLLLLRLLECV